MRFAKRWVSIRFAFRAGDTHLTRHFAETSAEKAEALARAWAKAQGYEFVGRA